MKLIFKKLKCAVTHPFVLVVFALITMFIFIPLAGIVWGAWPTKFSNCIEIGGGGYSKNNVCPIITECLDKGGCYPVHDGTLPKDRPFCLFGKDMTPEACYDSAWLREYLNP